MNLWGQEMQIYQFFVLLIVSANITQVIEFHPRAPVLKYQAREDLNDEEAPKY